MPRRSRTSTDLGACILADFGDSLAGDLVTRADRGRIEEARTRRWPGTAHGGGTGELPNQAAGTDHVEYLTNIQLKVEGREWFQPGNSRCR
jgi:hypothetical protein